VETSVTISEFLAYYRQCMRLKPVDAGIYSPLVLAYVGDAVYEIIIRTRMINHGSLQVSKLHRRSSELVRAGSQARLIKLIEGMLTQEEHAVYKRGRNAKSGTSAKNASIIDYRTATGLEALVGWLFLREEYGRLVDLVSQGLERMGVFQEAEKPGNDSGLPESRSEAVQQGNPAVMMNDWKKQENSHEI